MSNLGSQRGRAWGQPMDLIASVSRSSGLADGGDA
jgi:hypothetical protein